MPPECSHKLCKAEAREAVRVRNAWGHTAFRAPSPADDRTREYYLCPEHFASYFPRGLGFVDRENATRLKIQCKEVL